MYANDSLTTGTYPTLTPSELATSPNSVFTYLPRKISSYFQSLATKLSISNYYFHDFFGKQIIQVTHTLTKSLDTGLVAYTRCRKSKTVGRASHFGIYVPSLLVSSTEFVFPLVPVRPPYRQFRMCLASATARDFFPSLLSIPCYVELLSTLTSYS